MCLLIGAPDGASLESGSVSEKGPSLREVTWYVSGRRAHSKSAHLLRYGRAHRATMDLSELIMMHVGDLLHLGEGALVSG